MKAKHQEIRWALAMNFGERGWRLLGKYCWPNATVDEPKIRTFKTRKLAREARKTGCYRDEAKVVRVLVSVGIRLAERQR